MQSAWNFGEAKMPMSKIDLEVIVTRAKWIAVAVKHGPNSRVHYLAHNIVGQIEKLVSAPEDGKQRDNLLVLLHRSVTSVPKRK